GVPGSAGEGDAAAKHQFDGAGQRAAGERLPGRLEPPLCDRSQAAAGPASADRRANKSVGGAVRAGAARGGPGLVRALAESLAANRQATCGTWTGRQTRDGEATGGWSLDGAIQRAASDLSGTESTT